MSCKKSQTTDLSAYKNDKFNLDGLQLTKAQERLRANNPSPELSRLINLK